MFNPINIIHHLTKLIVKYLTQLAISLVAVVQAASLPGASAVAKTLAPVAARSPRGSRGSDRASGAAGAAGGSSRGPRWIHGGRYGEWWYGLVQTKVVTDG